MTLAASSAEYLIHCANITTEVFILFPYQDCRYLWIYNIWDNRFLCKGGRSEGEQSGFKATTLAQAVALLVGFFLRFTTWSTVNYFYL